MTLVLRSCKLRRITCAKLSNANAWFPSCMHYKMSHVHQKLASRFYTRTCTLSFQFYFFPKEYLSPRPEMLWQSFFGFDQHLLSRKNELGLPFSGQINSQRNSHFCSHSNYLWEKPFPTWATYSPIFAAVLSICASFSDFHTQDGRGLLSIKLYTGETQQQTNSNAVVINGQKPMLEGCTDGDWIAYYS